MLIFKNLDFFYIDNGRVMYRKNTVFFLKCLEKSISVMAKLLHDMET
jgi:hypothetical protein